MIIVDPTIVQPPVDGGGGVVVGPPAVFTAPLSWEWTSWTGDVWNLTDLASPVLKLRGATGAGPGNPEHWWADAPYVDGSSWEGARIPRGSVFLPLMVRGKDSNEFLANHSAFMRSLDPRQEGWLRVTRPDGESRTIGCRYESGGDLAMELDPVVTLSATYGITWATADPYWQGEPIILDFGYTDPAPLFPGPPFVINRARSLASATYSNPGDVASFPVWRITGPFDSFSVGFAATATTKARLISMDVAKPADGWVEIDTNPSELSMFDEDGQDMWLSATDADFAPLEPGQDVKLTTTLANAGPGASVTLTFTPRYRSAWA